MWSCQSGARAPDRGVPKTPLGSVYVGEGRDGRLVMLGHGSKELEKGESRRGKLDFRTKFMYTAPPSLSFPSDTGRDDLHTDSVVSTQRSVHCVSFRTDWISVGFQRKLHKTCIFFYLVFSWRK